jgi:hypothetical protein
LHDQGTGALRAYELWRGLRILGNVTLDSRGTLS